MESDESSNTSLAKKCEDESNGLKLNHFNQPLKSPNLEDSEHEGQTYRNQINNGISNTLLVSLYPQSHQLNHHHHHHQEQQHQHLKLNGNHNNVNTNKLSPNNIITTSPIPPQPTTNPDLTFYSAHGHLPKSDSSPLSPLHSLSTQQQLRTDLHSQIPHHINQLDRSEITTSSNTNHIHNNNSMSTQHTCDPSATTSTDSNSNNSDSNPNSNIIKPSQPQKQQSHSSLNYNDHIKNEPDLQQSASSISNHGSQYRRPTGFSARNKASLCISTSSTLPHTHLEIDQSGTTTPLSAQAAHQFILSPRPLIPISLTDSQTAFMSPPPTCSSTTTNTYQSLPSGLRPNDLSQISSSSSSNSSEDGPSANFFLSSTPLSSVPVSQLLPTKDTRSPQSNGSATHPTSSHVRHPSNSTSSIGPNVAGRIGVGGNMMVDPHNSAAIIAQKGGVGAGAFVYKVYNMLLDPSFQHLISFNSNGQSFTVTNVQEFSKVVLPKHFKHNNFSSFVRQLNMYGFHKVNKTPRGQRGNDNNASWEFIHHKFHRGRPDLLEQIRRKPLESESSSFPRKDVTSMNLTNFFIHPQASRTTTNCSMINDHSAFIPSGGPSPLQTLNPHLHAPPPPPYPISPTRAFSMSHIPHPSFSYPPPSINPTQSLLPEKSKKPDGEMTSNFSSLPPDSASHRSSISIPSQVYSQKLSVPSNQLHTNGSQSYSPRTVDTAGLEPEVLSPFSGHFDPTNLQMNHNLLGLPLDSCNTMNSEPNENFASFRNEMIARFHGVGEGYEALYRELYETRRRQDVLVDVCGRMYRTLQVLTNGNVGFPFPTQELFARPTEDTQPTFRITEHDHQRLPQKDHSPSVSDFPEQRNRPLSLDPTAFNGLTLTSYPSSPAYPDRPGTSGSDLQANSSDGVIKGKKRPATGSMDLSNLPPPAPRRS